jgi:hypothetical protein
MKKTYTAMVLTLICILLSSCVAPVSVEDFVDTPSDEIRIDEAESPSAPPDELDFRDVAWGMTQDEVIAAVGAQPDIIYAMGIEYSGSTLADLDCDIRYFFTEDDQLGMIHYIIDTINISDKNDNVDNYEALKSKLASRFGEPYIDEAYWDNDMYQNEPKKYGMAVSLGHLSYTAEWDTPNDYLRYMLHGYNEETVLILMMFSQDIDIYTDIDTGINSDPPTDTDMDMEPSFEFVGTWNTYMFIYPDGTEMIRKGDMEYAFNLTIQLEDNYLGYVYDDEETIPISWIYENGLGTIADSGGVALYTFEMIDEEMRLIEIPHEEAEPGVYVMMRM